MIRTVRPCTIRAMLLVVALCLCGCASPGISQTGIRVGDQTLAQFQAGQTTEAWLVAVLGKPTSQADVEGVPDTKVYRYATGEETRGILPMLVGQTSRITAVTYFVITDGIVTRFWADRATEPTVFGGNTMTEPGNKQKP